MRWLVAQILENHAARVAGTDRRLEGMSKAYSHHFCRLDGRAVELEIRLWDSFKTRRIRAAYQKLINRFNKTEELLQREEIPSVEQIESAIDWIAEQHRTTVREISRKADFDPIDHGGLTLVAFRRVTYEDRFALSFEDEPPPWEFGIQFDFTRTKFDAAAREKTVNDLTNRVGNLRCPQHGRPPHVVCHGPSPARFDLRIVTCCRPFFDTVESQLHRRGAR